VSVIVILAIQGFYVKLTPYQRQNTQNQPV
jgi:hypothetical protein